MNALRPCPFCNSPDVDPEGWASTDRKGPCCNACNATADTVEMWNARPETDEMLKAARVLAQAYTRDDHQIGFVIDGSPPHLYMASLQDVVEAWGVFRKAVHLPTEPMGERTFCDFPRCDCSMGAAERCKHPKKGSTP